MGIDVNDEKAVIYNPSHQQRVITDPSRPISEFVYRDLRILSVFSRRRIQNDNSDGNPLIYALKGIRGYTMSRRDFVNFYQCAAARLAKALADIEYDVVVPLPSSSKVCHILAERASRLSSRCAIEICLSKSTIGGALHLAPSPKTVETRLRKDYTSQLNSLQKSNPLSPIEMKLIKLSIRKYFHPIVGRENILNCANRNVLIIDDIVGSGTSLSAVNVLLKTAGAERVSALTLLGRLG